jgi:4-hydroxymandelate oxidase
MLGRLIGDLVPPDQPADALILGFAMPDLSPGRATATYLSHVCPGNPMAFAVCDQGCAAGFTALRLTRDYATDGGWRRVLVAFAEQARLDYDPPAPASVPTRHAAFAMLCDAIPAPAAGRRTGGGAPWLHAARVCPCVPEDRVSATLGRELAALPETEPAEAGKGQRTLVLGEGLVSLAGDGVPGWRSVFTLPGHPTTGVWRELAAWVAAPGGGCFAMADYDSALRYLCLAVFAKVATEE